MLITKRLLRMVKAQSANRRMKPSHLKSRVGGWYALLHGNAMFAFDAETMLHCFRTSDCLFLSSVAS